MITALRALVGAVPLLPDADEAREWAERELADPIYRAAEPTPFDRAARAVLDFLQRLFTAPVSGDWGPWAFVVLAVLAVAAIVVGLLIWGRPRRTARAHPAARALFDDDDGRSADELRADAAAAADRGDWDAAIVLRFRAFARGLSERGIVDPPPGATARAFARTAGATLPSLEGPALAAASVFDDVRYLGRPGTADAYALVRRLDETAVRARVGIPDAGAVAP
ncbi:DUF4129 domain-containing protein [Microbacterium sp. RURRCA19A]|uniref:DUF4129 domain-containing protein n=1 Tax=Microbacterium sp. RURRCA19A TaxID=1907391 RepID=UPI000954D8FC|nr:DUF4129 domain-containing protein [Microbacterium sp. RURRCA19A]SIR71093.1 protein of unknown function [Microbacterium sp. RURRCA19A]